MSSNFIGYFLDVTISGISWEKFWHFFAYTNTDLYKPKSFKKGVKQILICQKYLHRRTYCHEYHNATGIQSSWTPDKLILLHPVEVMNRENSCVVEPNLYWHNFWNNLKRRRRQIFLCTGFLTQKLENDQQRRGKWNTWWIVRLHWKQLFP